MAKDWSAERSPTVQAAENNRRNLAEQQKDALIAALHKDIRVLETALDDLGTVGTLTGNDDDLITAVRSLGAYQALLKRKLARETVAS